MTREEFEKRIDEIGEKDMKILGAGNGHTEKGWFEIADVYYEYVKSLETKLMEMENNL